MSGTNDWKDISGDEYDWTLTRAPERPYLHDYSRTMTMKMFLAEPDRRGGSRVCITIPEAADIIRRVDALTLGAPKIIYLVGWQYHGHDDRYPAWHEGNPHLMRPADHSPLDSIRWLMEEGRTLHTTVSVHINMYDAYENSPLWRTYREEGLLNLAANGDLEKGGVWNGLQAYTVNYRREWESGFAKKRIDELLDLLPLERAGTVHIDAFHCRPDPLRGDSWQDSQAARRKVVRYWRERGIDVTSEFLYAEPAFGWDRPGTDQLIGLQPMAWHLSQLPWDYIERPASLLCGGRAGHVFRPGGQKMGDLFGENITGEPLWTDMERKKGRADWEAPFLDEFCLKYLPFRFLNSRQRMSLTCRRGEIVASFDQAVETSTRGPKISQGGVLLRDGTDVFLPADWVSDRSIVTYSRNGGTRTWRLPSPLAAATGAVLQELTPEGPAAEQRCNVDDGKVSLAYRKGQAFLLTAAG